MIRKVQLLKGLAVVWCLWHTSFAYAKDSTLYSDDFRDHYPTRGQRFDLNRYQLEPPVVVWDQNQEKKITVLRTRGDKYGYEEQKCVLTMEGTGIKIPRFLSVLGFRNIETTWITGKLVLIRLGIGHVAGVDAIYDAENDKLVYCESVLCVIEQEGPANPRQRLRSETNRTSSATGSRH
jgi:hypothetical protein